VSHVGRFFWNHGIQICRCGPAAECSRRRFFGGRHGQQSLSDVAACCRSLLAWGNVFTSLSGRWAYALGVIQILPSIFKVVAELREEIWSVVRERQWREVQDRICKEMERQIQEDEARFKALPIEEQNRIIEERERYLERRRQEGQLRAHSSY
jgi:hypothetical protein